MFSILPETRPEKCLQQQQTEEAPRPAAVPRDRFQNSGSLAWLTTQKILQPLSGSWLRSQESTAKALTVCHLHCAQSAPVGCSEVWGHTVCAPVSPAWLGCSGHSITTTKGTCGENSAGTGTRGGGRVYPGTAVCNNLWINAWARPNPDCRITES